MASRKPSAVACSAPPEGRTRWTFKLLADKAVALEIVDTISAECVRTTLKNALKPWQQHQWVIPPQANAAFVCAMEDAGSVHTPLRSTASPGVPGRDQQTIGGRHPRPPAAAPGQPERVDYEYERKGTANLFMIFEPLTGQRQVKVTERRTAVDFAHMIQELVDVQYPQAEKIVLVLDNLNTHTGLLV